MIIKKDHGQFEVKVILESNCKCLDFYYEASSGPPTECILVDSSKWLGLDQSFEMRSLFAVATIIVFFTY